MNVDLVFDFLPYDGTERETKMSLLISSGTPLPEVLYNGIGGTQLLEYEKTGLLTDVTAYYKDASVMPNFNRKYDKKTQDLF